MLDRHARESLRVDGQDDGDSPEMSEEAPIGMDEVLEIIDPEDLLGSDDEDDEGSLSNDEMEDDQEEGAGVDGETASEPYVPERDDAKVTFTHHTKSVFCCDVDKSGLLAVTGGEDDQAHVWDLKTGEIKFSCTEHEDSVIAVKFNHDGSLVAIGDMVGRVQVWKVASKERVLDDSVGELTWMDWHPAINVVFAGASDGNITFWRVNSGESKVLPSMGVSTDVGKVMPDGTRAVIGYEDGSVRIFDLRSCKCLFTVPADSDSVKSLDCHRDNTLVLAGCVSGEAKLINTKNGKALGSLLCTDPHPSCVESVHFCPMEEHSDMAACVTTGGDISVWTVSRQEVRDAAMLFNDVTKLAWSRTDRSIILGTVLGDVEVYDGLDLSKEAKKLKGHSSSILDFCQTPDGKLLLTASDDHTAKVFEMPQLSD